MDRIARLVATGIVGLALLSLIGCTGTQSATPATTPTQEGTGSAAGDSPGALDGAALAQEKCTQCHAFGQVEAADYDQAGWESTIERMIGKGLQVTDAEKQAILDYLVNK